MNPILTAMHEGYGLRRTARGRLVAGALVAAGLLALALASGAPTAALAQTKIEVIINDEAITSYDVAQRARLLQLTTRKSAGAARKLAIDELIDERIKMQEAKRLGISVSDAQVEEAYATIAARTKMTPAKLSEALSRSGVKPSSLKERIRSEVAWGEVVRMRFRRAINVSEQDIVAALQKKEDDGAQTTTQYTLTQLIFVVPKNASNGLKTKRRQEADALRGRFTSCQESMALASEYSEVVVKGVGIRLAPELPPALQNAVADVDVGRLSKPLTTENGVELYAVCDKREIKSDAGARNEIEQQLRNKEGEMLARRYLRDLRRNAIIDYR